MSDGASREAFSSSESHLLTFLSHLQKNQAQQSESTACFLPASSKHCDLQSSSQRGVWTSHQLPSSVFFFFFSFCLHHAGKTRNLFELLLPFQCPGLHGTWGPKPCPDPRASTWPRWVAGQAQWWPGLPLLGAKDKSHR